MITASQLLREHEQGLDDRPHRMKRLRAPIREYTGLAVPRSVADVETWYSEHEDDLEAALREYADDGEEGEEP